MNAQPAQVWKEENNMYSMLSRACSLCVKFLNLKKKVLFLSLEEKTSSKKIYAQRRSTSKEDLEVANWSSSELQQELKNAL